MNMRNLKAVLEEFVKDIEAAYGENTDVGTKPSKQLVALRLDKQGGWPDLARTYEKAKKALENLRRFDPEEPGFEPLKITKWLRRAELPDVENTADLVDAMSGALDKACSWEIFGETIFECEDGKVYVATVEGVIEEINPHYLADLKAELEESESDVHPEGLAVEGEDDADGKD